MKKVHFRNLVFPFTLKMANYECKHKLILLQLSKSELKIRCSTSLCEVYFRCLNENMQSWITYISLINIVDYGIEVVTLIRF